MTMYNLGIDPGSVKRGAALDGTEGGTQRLRAMKPGIVQLKPTNRQTTRFGFLVAKTADLHIH